MKAAYAVCIAVAVLASLAGCQSDRFEPPGERVQLPPASVPAAPAVTSRPLPLYQDEARGGMVAPPGGPAAQRPNDPLPGAYATAQDRIAAARSENPDQYKPSGQESIQTAQARCEAMSRRASAHGVNVLIVAFEGLVSFDSGGTSAAYRYQVQKAAGDPRAVRPVPIPIPGIPFVGGGYVLNGLLMPLIDRFGDRFEFLVFRHFEQSESDETVPAVCARVWLSGAPGRRIVIVGHSAGGLAAAQLTRSLERARLWVDLVVTIDSVWTGGRAGNARRWENYHNAYPEVPGADVNRYIPTNHFAIPGSPEIVESLSRWLASTIAQRA